MSQAEAWLGWAGEIAPEEEGPSDAVEIETSGAGLFGALRRAHRTFVKVIRSFGSSGSNC